MDAHSGRGCYHLRFCIVDLRRGRVRQGLAVADNLTPEQRSYTMSRIRSTNTAPEMRVRRELHRRGLRYRVHIPGLPGKPDIVFSKRKIAIFLDGDFWHGWRLEQWKHKLSLTWLSKIERTRARDALHDQTLRSAGWQVLRYWEHEVKANCVAVADEIEAVVRGTPRRSSPKSENLEIQDDGN